MPIFMHSIDFAVHRLICDAGVLARNLGCCLGLLDRRAMLILRATLDRFDNDFIHNLPRVLATPPSPSLSHNEQQLPSGWPGPRAMQALVQMAVPLFIFAATSTSPGPNSPNVDEFHTVAHIAPLCPQRTQLHRIFRQDVPSFRDFLVDPNKRGTNPFWADEKAAHERIATRCVELLAGHLKEDICNLKMPGTARAGIEPAAISSHLPAEVR
ncbi:hypothetical protein QBC46DRAFT_432098, partial [Diplogelasinospora grovesii]